MLKTVLKYLRDINPRAKVKELSQNTNIPPKVIIMFIKEGKLNLSLYCARCGTKLKSIYGKQYCDDCSEYLKEILSESIFKTNSKKTKNPDKNTLKSNYYGLGKKYKKFIV